MRSWHWVARQTGGNFELYSYDDAMQSVESRRPAQHHALTRPERERAAGPPPRRDDDCYLLGTAGDEAFRAARCEWFQRFTGVPLEGSLATQNEQCDAIARRFRGYSDGRPTVWDRWA